jgi:phosphate:Na+ symporter
MDLNLFIQLTKILGGAGLFIYGMKVMTHSLEAAAGNQLRTIISKLMKNQFSGLLVGTLIAFLIHSGAATVMMTGFVNSGLMSFLQSIGFMIGTNIGTTLSMQIISFDIGKYCFLSIGIGFLIIILTKKENWIHLGTILIGFGILFLGMETMKDAVSPFKNSQYITKFFNYTDAYTVTGMITGIALSCLFTAIMQSSGAMIGILFALSSAGIITSYNTVFPLILGAHIGTCIVTVIGSIGTNSAARRAAWSHVMFNFIGAVIAAAMFPVYEKIVYAVSSRDLVHIIANTHTIVQCVNGIVFLLAIKIFSKLMHIIIKYKRQEEQGTFLDNQLIEKPESAISAAICELERMLEVTRKMLSVMMSGLKNIDESRFSIVLKNEEVTDKLKNAISDYCVGVVERKLSSRQTLMIQYINQTAIDIERIGDHIEKIIEFTLERFKKNVWYDEKDFHDIEDLFNLTDSVIAAVEDSLNPLKTDSSKSKIILKESIEKYKQYSKSVKEKQLIKIKEYQESAMESYFYNKYILYLDRIVKHLGRISIIENDEFFIIKPEKFEHKKDKVKLNIQQ